MRFSQTDGNEMIRVLLAGHRGKVGAALEPALAAAVDVDYVGGVGRGDDLAAALREKQPQVLVDFTHPGAGLENALYPVLTDAPTTNRTDLVTVLLNGVPGVHWYWPGTVFVGQLKFRNGPTAPSFALLARIACPAASSRHTRLP